MTKYRPSDKLTREQHQEMAHLENPGVPRKALAEGYHVSIHTIHALAQQRKKYLPSELHIARTPDEQVFWARGIYGNLSPEARTYIDDHVFSPVIRDVITHHPTAEEGLVHALFGGNRERERTERVYTALLEKVRERHSSRNQAVIGGKDHFYKDLEAYLAAYELEHEPAVVHARALLREKVQDVLATLTFREREIIKMRYGIGDGYTYTLEEVGVIFKTTRERARQI